MVLEKWYTTPLSHHAVAPAGLNFCPALHFHSHVCLRACLHGKIIAHKAGMWINSTSLQRTLQVQWGLVCTRTLLWRQPRCKSPLSWHQLPQTHCQCLHGPPGPAGLHKPSACVTFTAHGLFKQEEAGQICKCASTHTHGPDKLWSVYSWK